MHIEVTFRNLQARAEVKRRAEILYGKLHKFLDASSEAQMTVAIEHSVAVVDIHVSAHGHSHKVSDENPELRDAIDGVFHKLEAQLRKSKERKSDRKQSAGRGKDDGFGESVAL